MQRCIAESIKAKFTEEYDKANENPIDFLDNALWIYQDLMRIEEDVVPCFPPDWEVYNLWVREYHKALNETVDKIVSTDPEASVLLTLHAWIKEYKKSMKELAGSWMNRLLLISVIVSVFAKKMPVARIQSESRQHSLRQSRLNYLVSLFQTTRAMRRGYRGQRL